MKSEPALGAANGARPQSGRGILNAYSTIFTAFCVVTLPLLVLSGVLLALVFANRITSLSFGHGNLQYSQFVDESGAYYVDFSATRLTTVASWTSSVAPLLPGFLMTLLSFPVAFTLREEAKNADSSRLPTPYQLSVLLELYTARLGSLLQWARYFTWKRRSSQVLAIKLSVSCLAIAIGLAYLILAADTWLHVATNSVLLSQIVPSEKSTYSYGRQLSSACLNYQSITSNPIVPCIVQLGGTSDTGLLGARDAIETLNNISAHNLVATTAYESRLYSYLVPARPRPDLDFRASTVALHTECRPISRKCNLTAAFGASTPYECSPAFLGDLTQSNTAFNVSFFEDGELATVAQTAVNPFFLGLAALVPTVSSFNDSLYDDPEIVHPIHGGDGIIAQCKVTVYHFTYSLLNGTATLINSTLADEKVTEQMIGPMLYTAYGYPMIQLGLRSASLASTSQEYVDKFASVFNLVSLSLSTGAFDDQLNIEEQTRNNILVARIPKAPLFALVAFNIIFVLYGLAVFTIAMLSHPRETSNIQARLSLSGLVASKFEGARAEREVSELEDMFQEREGNGEVARVAVERTEQGGWAFTLRTNGS